jgi:hypothetical protein
MCVYGIHKFVDRQSEKLVSLSPNLFINALIYTLADSLKLAALLYIELGPHVIGTPFLPWLSKSDFNDEVKSYVQSAGNDIVHDKYQIWFKYAEFNDKIREISLSLIPESCKNDKTLFLAVATSKLVGFCGALTIVPALVGYASLRNSNRLLDKLSADITPDWDFKEMEKSAKPELAVRLDSFCRDSQVTDSGVAQEGFEDSMFKNALFTASNYCEDFGF